MGCFWSKPKTEDLGPEPQPITVAEDFVDQSLVRQWQFPPWAEDNSDDFLEIGFFTTRGPGGEEILATNLFSYLSQDDIDKIHGIDRPECPIAREILEIDLFVRPDGEDALGWRVDISLNGQVSSGLVELRDPFSAIQERDCRWYIDDYVTQSPYSVTRARQIIPTLVQYHASLVDQLGLVKLVNNYFASYPRGHRGITISISEDEGVKHSVHQLHWEMLEEPSWICEDEESVDEVEITVKRTVISEGKGKGALVHEVTLAEEGESGLPRVNGLLVVARDLSRNPNGNEDVSPHLALGVLARIQEDFKKTRSQAFLNLEVVRPGSLEALEKHLQRATEIHGKNYYHFIHLDVHGFVKPSDGVGYLLFNSADPPADPNVDEVVAEKAETVAEIVGQHGVTVAVLNACESARANRGDAANIAKTFIQHGVKNVLGMSYTISSSAADLALRAFYHYLFLEGSSFYHSAFKAREVLRCNLGREARLGLKRDLLDFFVPVVYSCGQDSRFIPVRSKGKSSGLEGSYYIKRRIAFEGEGGQLIGREFDLLRLEKKLLAEGKVYLTGRPGVGKSAMLRHASRIWQQTCFVDIVLFLDFTNVNISGDGGLRDVIDSLVSQIPLFTWERDTLRNDLMDLITSPTLNVGKFTEVLLRACSQSRLMIICDGLNAFPPVEYSTKYGDVTWDDAVPMVMLRRLMEALLHLGNVSTPHVDTIYYILVSRLATTRLLPFLSSEESLFKLPSLNLSYSTELSQLVLRRSGLSIDDWVEADLSELELLLGLLDGNPSAILHVMPQMAETGKSCREFRFLVQLGILARSDHDEDMLDCIHEAFHQLGDEARDFLLLLSTVWHESMCVTGEVTGLLEWATSHNICTREVATTVLFSFYGRGGLIDLNIDYQGPDRVNPGLLVTWVHPLLTICGRQIAHEILTERRSPSVAAALLLSTLGVQFDQTTISEQTQILCADFQKWFLQSVAAFNEFRDEANSLTGFDFQDLRVIWSSAALNLATCLSICTRQPHLPIDQWPKAYFQLYLRSIALVASPAQLNDYAKSFEQLLEIFINFNGSCAVETPKDQLFALDLVLCLTGIYYDKVPDAVKFQKYVDDGLQILRESEERFGEFKDSRVRYFKSLHLRFYARYLMEFGSREEAFEVWKAAYENGKSILKEKRSVGHLLQRWSPEEIQALAKELSSDDAEAEATAVKRLTALSANKAVEAELKSFEYTTQHLCAMISTEDKDEDTAFSPKSVRQILAAELRTERIFESAGAMGYRGMNLQESWQAQKRIIEIIQWESFQAKKRNISNILDSPNKFQGPNWNLEGLENAIAAGNSAKAIKLLSILYMEAYENLEFDQAEEFFNSLEKYSKQIAVGEGRSVDWEKEREYLTAWTTVLGILHGKPTKETLQMRDPAEHLEESLQKLISLLKERNAPREDIKTLEIRLKRWQTTDQVGRMEEIASSSVVDCKKFIRGAIARAQDEEADQKWREVNLQFQQHRLRMHEAELKQDPELALQRLDEMEEFLGQPGSEVLEESHDRDARCSKIRLLYEFGLIAKPVEDLIDDAFSREDFDEARRIIESFEKDVSPKFGQHPSKWIAKKKVVTEELAVTTQVRDALIVRNDGKEALRLVQKFENDFSPDFRQKGSGQMAKVKKLTEQLAKYGFAEESLSDRPSDSSSD